MAYEDQLNQIRARLSVGSLTDAAFDQLLSARARSKSSQHWSPFCVGRRAALRFAERGARRILDVGSGPGKFCIAAASARPELEVHGIEQRAGLAASAITLARRLGLRNLQLRAGDALLAPWRTFDGFYFFNPFAENVLTIEDTIDQTVELSPARFCTQLLQVAKLLTAARKGTVIVTYHGLGGFIPSSYDLIREELVGAGCLRTWVKTTSREAAWYHVDQADDVSRTTRARVEGKLLAPLFSSPGAPAA